MDTQRADRYLRRFAAVVVHELRTPLTALSGEVEIALRRERSPAAYRETLERVGGLIGELADLSRDLAIYADLAYVELFTRETSRLGECVDQAARAHPGLVSCALDDAAVHRRVVGNSALLVRALTLLLNHAVRHRPSETPVRVASVPQGAGADEQLVLLVDAPPGFEPHVWAPLPGTQEQSPIEEAAMFRLPTAARIIAGCGGSVDVHCLPGSAILRVRLLVSEP
jgi:signal transduction histidine kinase